MSVYLCVSVCVTHKGLTLSQPPNPPDGSMGDPGPQGHDEDCAPCKFKGNRQPGREWPDINTMEGAGRWGGVAEGRDFRAAIPQWQETILGALGHTEAGEAWLRVEQLLCARHCASC